MTRSKVLDPTSCLRKRAEIKRKETSIKMSWWSWIRVWFTKIWIEPWRHFKKFQLKIMFQHCQTNVLLHVVIATYYYVLKNTLSASHGTYWTVQEISPKSFDASESESDSRTPVSSSVSETLKISRRHLSWSNVKSLCAYSCAEFNFHMYNYTHTIITCFWSANALLCMCMFHLKNVQ